MNFIMVPLVTGIVTLGIYKFFELLICRRERREIIGKLEPGSLIDYLKLVPMGLRTGATIRTASETAPGIPAGARSSAIQSLVDLAPTFLEFAKVPVPRVFSGISQKSVWL